MSVVLDPKPITTEPETKETTTIKHLALPEIYKPSTGYQYRREPEEVNTLGEIKLLIAVLILLYSLGSYLYGKINSFYENHIKPAPSEIDSGGNDFYKIVRKQQITFVLESINRWINKDTNGGDGDNNNFYSSPRRFLKIFANIIVPHNLVKKQPVGCREILNTFKLDEIEHIKSLSDIDHNSAAEIVEDVIEELCKDPNKHYTESAWLKDLFQSKTKCRRLNWIRDHPRYAKAKCNIDRPTKNDKGQ